MQIENQTETVNSSANYGIIILVQVPMENREIKFKSVKTLFDSLIKFKFFFDTAIRSLNNLLALRKRKVMSELHLNLNQDDNINQTDDLKTNTPMNSRPNSNFIKTINTDESEEKYFNDRVNHSPDESAEVFEDYEEDPNYRLVLERMEQTLNANQGYYYCSQNKTFTSKEMREIDRNNAILMNKIMSHNRRTNQYFAAPKFKLPTTQKLTSAAVNRKKLQQKIASENQVLLRRIQTVKPTVSKK